MNGLGFKTLALINIFILYRIAHVQRATLFVQFLGIYTMFLCIKTLYRLYRKSGCDNVYNMVTYIVLCLIAYASITYLNYLMLSFIYIYIYLKLLYLGHMITLFFFFFFWERNIYINMLLILQLEHFLPLNIYINMHFVYERCQLS